MRRTDKQTQWERLVDYMQGNQATWIVDIGIKAGLFRAIRDTPGRTEHELAAALDYSPRLMLVWCRAAFAYELLDWEDGGGYRLAAHMDAILLDPADPKYLGGRMSFTAALYEDFAAFPRYLAKDGVWPRSEHAPAMLESLALMTAQDVFNVLQHVLPQAPRALATLERGGRLLDLGAGSGFHAIQYARRFPEARVTALEPDGTSVAQAREAIAAAALDPRVEVLQMDASALTDEKVYDLVTMNLSLHEMGGPTGYRIVLERAHRAMKPGGTVLISELPYPDSLAEYRAGPFGRLLAGVQLHEAIVGCGMITKNQLRELMNATGFVNLRVADQPMPTRFVMLGERDA